MQENSATGLFPPRRQIGKVLIAVEGAVSLSPKDEHLLLYGVTDMLVAWNVAIERLDDPVNTLSVTTDDFDEATPTVPGVHLEEVIG